MNWLKSLQKLTQLLVGDLEETQDPVDRGVEAILKMSREEKKNLEVFMAAFYGKNRKNKEKNGPRLILPPGMWLRDMLRVIYPPKTIERVFDQIIADMQLEWQEAMIQEDKLQAGVVRVRGVLTVFLTMAVHAAVTLRSILKLVK